MADVTCCRISCSTSCGIIFCSVPYQAILAVLWDTLLRDSILGDILLWGHHLHY